MAKGQSTNSANTQPVRYELVGKRAISVNGHIYNRGDVVDEETYAQFPARVKAFFKPEGKRKK